MNKLAGFVLLVGGLAACGGSQASQTSGTGPTTTASGSTTSSASMGTATPASGTTTSTAMTTGGASGAQPLPKGSYSCFSYSQKGATEKRNACMRTEECDAYLEQARQVGGIVASSGCTNVSALWCFHQAPTKTDPQGLDVCQPSMEACTTERGFVVKSGLSVDSDCAAR